MNIELINNLKRFDNCPLCNSSLIYKVGSLPLVKPTLYSSSEISLKRGYEYWRCRGCWSGFSQNIVSEIDSKRLYTYTKNSKWQSKEFELNKTKELVNEVNKYLLLGSKVLDIGSNTGELLDYCKKKGLDTFGVEYSEFGKKVSKDKGHTIYESLERIEKNKKFDLVFAFDLVEHLYDINIFFYKVKNILKDGGKLIILTGNPNCMSSKLSKNKWWYLCYPEHVIFPSKNFFSGIENFKLISCKKTYNSIGYEEMFIFYSSVKVIYKFVRFIRDLFLNKYNGLLSVDKDHHLIILQKI
ncbi:MAG: class I SAM-dependent methyltransferase [Patescibacteria group bacterium]|nr:class I SAM-dependent methyltransferase [Patescibacteria group bacterium]